MNSAALLDLLGNENRRRILRLLAQKPCYVTEISEYLGVSPKAVIDHLRKLEDAGLIESQVDDQRRKYFHIARNLRLEVELSPYRFGTKSAYPASVNLDLTRCRYLTLDVDAVDRGSGPDVTDPDAAPETDAAEADGDVAPTEDPRDLADSLRRLERLEEELSLAQRWVQGRLADVMGGIGDAVEAESEESLDSRLYADVLLALREGRTTPEGVAEETGAPPELIEDALAALASADLVERHDGRWAIPQS
jgi:ArsR family transcriptional regulator